MIQENVTPKIALETVIRQLKLDFVSKNNILSFEEFVSEFFKKPKKLARNSAKYIFDMFHYYGIENFQRNDGSTGTRYKIFERPRGKGKSTIVGQEDAHAQIYKILAQFVEQGRSDKLILLHGPNGSSKSSTAEALALAMEDYSKTEEGAIYMFNWIFPNDKIATDGLEENSDNKKIGFGDSISRKNKTTSFAHLPEAEILCKLVSELRENPLFILPAKERIALYESAVSEITEIDRSKECYKTTLLNGALSSKNKKIMDALLIAYQGDFLKVLKHVQVERIYFSSRYKTGIATVEPQIAMDVHEKQITMEKNLQNLPPALQNTRFYEVFGELVDANRGFIEFSDLLKRPLEAFKYLLTATEKMSVNLPSGTTDLDLIMIASTNEKHLDAFKTSPDWQSFKGRFELIRVPYLLSSKLEELIYSEDLKILESTKKVDSHAVSLLAKWSVLTRLRQPDPDFFETNIRGLVARLDPFDKLALYDGTELSNQFNEQEKSLLKKSVGELIKESQSSIAYEGRFGASPREAKMLLYFASQRDDYDSVCALGIFDELENMTRDRTVYEYLQFEPRNGYHDHKDFLKHIKQEYVKHFQKVFLVSLNLFDENQYIKAFDKYLKHVVAYLKKEKIYNESSGKTEEPNEGVMTEIEELMGMPTGSRETREFVLNKVASWKVENANTEIQTAKIFALELASIARKIYDSKRSLIDKIQEQMLMWNTSDYAKDKNEIYDFSEKTFENLEFNHGYSKKTSWQSLIFCRQFLSIR